MSPRARDPRGSHEDPASETPLRERIGRQRSASAARLARLEDHDLHPTVLLSALLGLVGRDG